MSSDMEVRAALMTVLGRAELGARHEAILVAQRAQQEVNNANARVATMINLVDASRTHAATLEMDIDDLNRHIELQDNYTRDLEVQVETLQRELQVEKDVVNALNPHITSTSTNVPPCVHAPSEDVPEDPMQQAVKWLVTSNSLHEKLASKDSSVTLSAAELRMLNAELKGAKDRAMFFSTFTDNQQDLIARQAKDVIEADNGFVEEYKKRVRAERALSRWADNCVDIQNKVATAGNSTTSSCSQPP